MDKASIISTKLQKTLKNDPHASSRSVVIFSSEKARKFLPLDQNMNAIDYRIPALSSINFS